MRGMLPIDLNVVFYMGLYPFTYSIGISAATIIAQRKKIEGKGLVSNGLKSLSKAAI